MEDKSLYEITKPPDPKAVRMEKIKLRTGVRILKAKPQCYSETPRIESKMCDKTTEGAPRDMRVRLAKRRNIRDKKKK